MAKDAADNRAEQVAREDLVMFVNACFSCTDYLAARVRELLVHESPVRAEEEAVA